MDRIVLADHPAMETLVHVNQLLDLAFYQPADRDMGPLADDVRDVLLVDLFLQHPLVLLQLGQTRFLLADLLLELRHAAVLKLGGGRVVARALGPFHLLPHRFQLLLQ